MPLFDYSASSNSIFIPAGATAGAVQLQGLNDSTYEGTESIAVEILRVINGTEDGDQRVTTSILDNEPAPFVILGAGPLSIAENQGAVTIIATLSNPSAEAVVVGLSFEGSTVYGVDYSASAASIIVAAGETSASTTLGVVNDNIDEMNEVITIDVSSVTGGTENGSQQVTITIIDDDLPRTPLRPLELHHAFSVGGVGQDGAWGVDFDASGNSLIVGNFRETVDFDPGIAVASITSGLSYAEDIFAAKYTPEGQLIWAKAVYGPQGFDFVRDVRFNPSRDSFVMVGNFERTVDFDMGSATVNLTSVGGRDAFVARYDADGNIVWTFRIGGSGTDSVESVRWDNGGNLLVGGYFSGTADFDPGPSSVTLTSDGGADAFLAKYDLSGHLQWVRQFGGASESQIRGLGVDSTDAVIATGFFDGSIDLDPTTNTKTVTSNGNHDAMVAKVAANGDLIWANSTGGTGDDRGLSVSVDSNDAIYYTGIFDAAVDFDPQVPVFLVNASTRSTFASKLAPNGNLVWAVPIASGTSGNEQRRSIAVDHLDNIYISGYFTSQSSDFDPGPGTHILGSAGDNDIFVSCISSDSELLWAGAMGGTGRDNGMSLAVSDMGVVYAVGQWGLFNASGDFDPGAGSYVLTGPGAYDIFVAALSPMPTITLEYSGTSSLVESSVSLDLVLKLNETSSQPTIVTLASSGSATIGLDYALPSQVMIPSGSTSAGVSLVIADDNVFEGSETVSIRIGATNQGMAGSSREVALTILDNDRLPSVSLEIAGSPIAEDLGAGYVLALLSNPSTQDIIVSLGFGGAAELNVDYLASSNAIVVFAGQTSGSITVSGVDDLTFEGSESLVVEILNITNGTENGTQSIVAAIADNDALPSVTLHLSGDTLKEDGGVATVTALLSNPSVHDLTVDLSTTGSASLGVDYFATSTSVTIPAGSLSGTLSFTSVNDLLREGDESIVVDIVAISGGVKGTPSQVTTSITDDTSDPFQLIDDTLTLLGTLGNDNLSIDYGISINSFTASVNRLSGQFSSTKIVIQGSEGSDTLAIRLSSLADDATLNGSSGSISSSGYVISYANVETTVLNGDRSDQVTYIDPGVVNTSYLLPQYGILQGSGFTNLAIAFGNHTVNALGNDDNLFVYGDVGAQAYIATPIQARMPVGSQLLIGNNFKRVYAYGMGGNDTATYSGSAADETMTALWNYTFVNSASTVQYFDSFKTLTVRGNGGFDTAVMYDSPGVDTFTASDTSFRYTRSGVFSNIANGYDRVYAFNHLGGFDTATLNGSSGNDRLTSLVNYSVLVTPTTLQQATGFRTVIVNAGTGNDTATLQDSTGSDTLNAFAGTAELVYANGRTARAIGFDTVNVNGTLGGTNRRNINAPTYQLKFKGTWV